MLKTYQLNPFNQIFTHGKFPALLVRDGRDEDDMSEVKAVDIQVRSGDYFITLATNLDVVSDSLAKLGHVEAENLEVIVHDLMYLQQHYKIVKK